MRRAALIRLSAALLALAATFGAPARAEARDLSIGIAQYPSTFNPMIDAMVAKSYVLGMARRPITTWSPDWNLVCMLCVELPSFENGLARIEDLPDGGKGVALTVKLDPQAVWGDGTPIGAADLVFSWQVGRHPNVGVGNAEGYRRILSIDVVDEKTAVLHVDRVSFDYNDMSGFDVLPAHLESAAFGDPAEYRHRTLYDTDTTNPGLYSGPYRIASVTPGSRVELVRNEHWWGAPPAFERITVRTIENTAALEANLLAGDVDYVAGELGFTLDQALAIEKRHAERFDTVYREGLQYEHVDLNLSNPVLADRRVRQALLHGIDRQAISERLFEGRQPVAHGFVSPLDPMHADDLPAYGYDPARAGALLDEAGWTAGAGGMRRNEAGEVLRLELSTTAGNRVRELVQQVLQAQWKALGIDIVIRNEPARLFFGETVTKRKFPAMAMFAWVSAPESVPRTTQHSQMIPTEENGWTGQNYTGYSLPRVDALIDAIEVELDVEKRRAMWLELQRIYAEELPVLPLFFRSNPYVLPKWLKGVRPTGHQFQSTLWVEEWRAEE